MIQKEQLNSVAKWIEAELGIVYSSENYFQLENRLVEIMKDFQISDPNQLINQTQHLGNLKLRNALLDAATNNETSFFRDKRVFDAFQTRCIPALLEQFPRESPIRIWSAACSTGQEPTTLSILWQEVNAYKITPPLELVATDISSRALERAKSGQFTDLEIGRGMPPDIKQKYFMLKSDGSWNVRPDISARIRFQRQNLCESFIQMGRFHVIFLRNMLIYQRIEKKVDIVQRLARQLAPGGYLVMGAGESLLGVSEGFEQADFGGCIYYRLKAGQLASAS